SRIPFSNPGNVFTLDGSNLNGLNTPFAGIPKGSTGIGLTPAAFAATAGLLNKTSLISYIDYLSPSQRYGLFVSGTYQLTSSVQLFAESLYNHQDRQEYGFPPPRPILVPASNVYNPFGEPVLVLYLFAGFGRQCNCGDTEYFRPLAGIRGTLGDKWRWELAGWTSRDREDYNNNVGVTQASAINAALTAGTFNPFQDGRGGATGVLNTFFGTQRSMFHGDLDSINGFLRGPIVELPSGTVEGVVGGEYKRDVLRAEDSLFASIGAADTNEFTFHRSSRAAFAEIKLPIIGNRVHPEDGAILAAQVAARYDDYSDFGARTSHQIGLQFRPERGLLLRA